MIIRKIVALAAAGLFASAALAQVTVTEPWIRATVPAQKSSGAFMQLRSPKDARLVGVRTPVAGNVEIHQMEMQGQAMKMRAVDGIELPAGQVVNLASGGYHVMLFDLKRQLKDGETVPLTLVVEDARRQRSEVNVAVPVRPLGYSGATAH
ncbi:MAG: copper chaperone PCu(A)C [Massilia sp.]